MGVSRCGLADATQWHRGLLGLAIAGALIGGMLYEDMGPFWMFLWAGVWVRGGLLLFAG